MSRMSDREAWISVFNTALTAAMDHERVGIFQRKPKLFWCGQEVDAVFLARMTADQALRDAPKDEA